MTDTLDASLEAGTSNPKRKQAEAFIINHVNIMDPGGSNGKRYRALFDSWSDMQFHTFMEGLRDKTMKIVLYVPNLKLNLQQKDLFKCADALGIKIFERVRLWDSTTNRYVLTPQEYPILRLPVRRLKQYLMDKISVAESDSKIDAFSGQVVRPDKGSSISSVECQTILSKGLKTSISELIRVRGGDLAAYASFKSQLEETGFASLNEVPADSRARSTVILATYLTAMHIQNNL